MGCLVSGLGNIMAVRKEIDQASEDIQKYHSPLKQVSQGSPGECVIASLIYAFERETTCIWCCASRTTSHMFLHEMSHVKCCLMRSSDVRNVTSQITHHESLITHHTCLTNLAWLMPCKSRMAHALCDTHLTHHTSCVTHHASHITRLTSCITHHVSHITRLTWTTHTTNHRRHVACCCLIILNDVALLKSNAQNSRHWIPNPAPADPNKSIATTPSVTGLIADLV